MTSAQVCEYASITYRQLDHWCRKGYVPGQPANFGGPGSSREFTLRQARYCRVVGAVVKTGISIDKARAIATEAGAGQAVHELAGGLKLFLPHHLVETS